MFSWRLFVAILWTGLQIVPATLALREAKWAHIAHSEPSEVRNLVWEEVEPEDEGLEEKQKDNPQPRRPLLSFDGKDNTKANTNLDKKEEVIEPHPLRTDKFLLKIRWRRKPWTKLPKMMIFEFNQQGHARYINPRNEDPFSVLGEWESSSATLSCRIPMATDVIHRETVVFTADVSLNPFGPQPKLLRGVILEEHQRTFGAFRFRNVLGTFTGEGIGDDMVDLSYRRRKRS